MEKRITPAERYDLSKFFPFWDELAGVHQKALTCCPVFTYDDGEKILIPASERNGYLLVLRGGIRVYISSEGGREFTLYRVKAGGFCGILPVDGPGIPNIEADGSCALIHVTKTILQPILSYLPRTSDFFLGCLGDNMQSVLTNIENTFFGTLKSSVARLILENCPEDSCTVKITTSRLQIISAPPGRSSAARSKASATWGLITAGRGRITVIDRAGLESMAHP
jgi:CRP/FNR family transcriptional regulator